MIKLLSLFPLANARGPEIDQGTLVRFLNEIITREIYRQFFLIMVFVSSEQGKPTEPNFNFL